MAETKKINVFVLIDEAGDYVATHDEGLLEELYEDNISDCNNMMPRRYIRVELQVPLPTQVVVYGEIPPETPPENLTLLPSPQPGAQANG